MASHPVLETRQVPGSSRAQSRGGKEFRLALGTNLSAARGARLACQAHSWPSFVSLRGREGIPCLHPTPRSTGGGVAERVVDPGAYCQSDLAPVSWSLPSSRDLAALADDGVELPKARAPRLSAQRSSDCSLAPLPLAAYKKRLHDWEPTWFSWMKAAFCSSPISNARGLQRDKLPTVRCATSKGESMCSVLWPCRPSASAWPSTCSFIPAQSEGRKWWSFLKPCLLISVARWSCYGIVAPFIGASWSKTFCIVTPVSLRNTFLLMLPNSIRPSTYGTVPTIPWLTAPPGTRRISNDGCALSCSDSDPRSRCYGPVSMLLTYPGLAKQAFLSFDETQ